MISVLIWGFFICLGFLKRFRKIWGAEDLKLPSSVMVNSVEAIEMGRGAGGSRYIHL